MNVNNVESVLADQKAFGHIKKSTLGKSLTNVHNVGSVLAKQES